MQDQKELSDFVSKELFSPYFVSVCDCQSQWQKLAPDTVFLEDQRYGHLLPLEDSTACFSLILQGFSELNSKRLT